MFNINTDQLIEDLLSPRLRTTTVLQVLKSILQPIKSLVSWLNSFRTATATKLSYNGQVCSLERLLNDRFDPVNRLTYITDDVTIAPLIAYPKDDVLRRIIVSDIASFPNYNVIARDQSEVGGILNKFVVNVHNDPAIVARENELIAIVRQIKLSGTIFKIRYYYTIYD